MCEVPEPDINSFALAVLWCLSALQMAHRRIDSERSRSRLHCSYFSSRLLDRVVQHLCISGCLPEFLLFYQKHHLRLESFFFSSCASHVFWWCGVCIRQSISSRVIDKEVTLDLMVFRLPMIDSEKNIKTFSVPSWLFMCFSMLEALRFWMSKK